MEAKRGNWRRRRQQEGEEAMKKKEEEEKATGGNSRRNWMRIRQEMRAGGKNMGR